MHPFITFLHEPLYLIHLLRYIHQVCTECLWLCENLSELMACESFASVEFDKRSRSSGVIILKKPYTPLILIPGLCNMQTTCKKSWLLILCKCQVRPCPSFRSVWVIILKGPYYPPYYWPLELEFCFKVTLLLFKRPTRDACLCMGDLQAPPAPVAPAAPHFVFLITL